MSQRLGGCRLERAQSKSDHSNLFRAYSEELQRPVMIKVLSARYPAGSKTAKRFMRGGNLAVELEHPNIVRTFAAGTDRGRPYMLMQFVEGHDLGRILEARERIPWQLATGMIRQVAKALDYAGERGIVHRSIEPSHIMLSPGGRITVLGFGRARLMEGQDHDAAITMEGSLVHVTPYSPPETGEGVQDTRGDLYSLGCLYYHLLTGNPPFEARDPLAMLRLHRTEHPWPAEDLVEDLPEAIAALLEKLQAKDMDQRFGSSRQVIAAIDAAIRPDVLGAKGIRPDRTLVASTMEMMALREKVTVLLCDDQDSTLRALRETLRRLGITPLTTRDGRAALETARQRELHMIVTDLKMPGLTGQALLRALHDARPDSPILLTRTGVWAESLYAGHELGIAACLPRPLDLFALRRTVQSLLQMEPGGRS